jgi:hypothetical protein
VQASLQDDGEEYDSSHAEGDLLHQQGAAHLVIAESDHSEWAVNRLLLIEHSDYSECAVNRLQCY